MGVSVDSVMFEEIQHGLWHTVQSFTGAGRHEGFLLVVLVVLVKLLSGGH